MPAALSGTSIAGAAKYLAERVKAKPPAAAGGQNVPGVDVPGIDQVKLAQVYGLAAWEVDRRQQLEGTPAKHFPPVARAPDASIRALAAKEPSPWSNL